MHASKKIPKIFYLTIIISMVISMSSPSDLVAAQTIGEIQKLPNVSTDIQQLSITPEVKTKEIPVPFNFPNNQLDKNRPEGNPAFKAETNTATITQEIISDRLLTKPFQLKSKTAETSVSSNAPLTADRIYFDNLVQKLNPPRPQSLTGAKSLGWSKISFEKPLSIKDLVKQVPNELADKIEFPKEEIIKGESKKGSRTVPLLGLQPEYLIFFAKQGGVNPANQTLKISNRGEGTIDTYD